MKGILLRGWSREQRHWGPFLEHLRAQMPEVDFQCFDLPGSGTEWGRPSPWTINGMVSDLKERRSAHRGASPEPALLIGISMGGMIALEWARQCPGEFAEVVLINSSLAGLSWPWERLRVRRLGELARIALSRDPVDREFRVLKMTTGLSEKRCHELAGEWASIAASAPVSTKAILAQVLAASAYRLKDPPNVRCLVLTSKGDRLVRTSCSERIAQRLGAQIRQHPTAGHDLPLEDPEWVCQEIARFHKTGSLRAAKK